MSLVLTPYADDGLPTIRVDDVLFPVGRDEAGFRDLPDSRRAVLEPRHARIFGDRGGYFVVDLGSASGTRVNGKAVTTSPVALAAGDTLAFGDGLVYTVSFAADPDPDPDADADADAAVAVADTRRRGTARAGLLLLPLDDAGGQPPIAIDEFPFLIGKDQAALSAWGQRQPEAFAFLSRRHAQVSRRGDGFLIEDLASTNGTWVNGRRERDSTRPLGDGDTVSFGQEHQGFRVALRLPDAKAPLPEGTILVSRAESFLAIYCESGPASAAASGAPGTAADAPAGGTVAARVMRQLRGPWSRRGIGIVGAFLVVALIAGVLQGLRDDRPDQVRDLLDREAYADAARLAAAYLADDPGHAGVRRDLATALEGIVVPDWLAAHEAGDRARAAAVVDAAPPGIVVDGLDWPGLLRWLGDASAFDADTGGLARYVLFRDESRLAALVEDPARPPSPPPPSLAALIERHPGLDGVYRGGVSLLRRLRDDATTYLPAIAALRRDLREAIDGGSLTTAGELLDRFADRYPRIDGVDPVRQDLAGFAAWSAAVDARDLAAFAALQAGFEPLTPPLREAWRQRSDALGDMSTRVAAWQAASTAWREGDLARADAALATLDADAWARSAARQRARWQALLDEFETLQSGPADETAASSVAARLSALYLELDAVDDAWLRQRVQQVLTAREPALRGMAEDHLARGETAWRDYSVTHGGIDSGLRLEPRVSDAFRERARALQVAHSNASLVARLDYFLDETQQARAGSLYRAVTIEVARQRQALNSLANLLEPAVIDEKLALMPAPEA